MDCKPYLFQNTRKVTICCHFKYTFSGYVVLVAAYVNNIARLRHKFCFCVFKECTLKPFCSRYCPNLSIVSVIEKCLLHSSYSQIGLFALGC